MSITQRTKYLLVTCCLEETRGDILKEVVENLVTYSNVFEGDLTIIDNASTLDWVVPYLISELNIPVHVVDQNVGYWSAIQWWLTNIEQSEYTYIIESDMIHYAMEKLAIAEKVLDEYDYIGSIRCQQYSVRDMHLYNKDAPHPDSKRNVWQSHTNKVTGEPIHHTHLLDEGDTSIYTNAFLTQLPALNRASTLKICIDDLANEKKFTEQDFQRRYNALYRTIGIIDGGIYHHDPGCVYSGVVTGSWTNPQTLKNLGYKGTRYASIVPLSSYNVRVQT